MRGQIYMKNVVDLRLNVGKCVGCGMCETVCPHSVFKVTNAKAAIVDLDACMECGACDLNCPVDAISAGAGVGCAVRILSPILSLGRRGNDCCCDYCIDVNRPGNCKTYPAKTPD